MISTKDFISQLESHFTSKLPFVAFRNPDNGCIKAFLQQNNELYKASDFSESGFIFAPFDDSQDAILIPLSFSKSIETKGSISKRLTKQTFKKPKIYYSISEEDHINLVEKGLKSINSGKLKKVVLSRYEVIKLENGNPLDLFFKLLQTYKMAFVYCWYHPKVGLWLGATPETLLKVKGTSIETMALAGTQIYNGTLNVEWKSKEKEEQQFVTDFIVKNIKPKVNNLKVSDVETIKAGKVLHLLTKISGELKVGKPNIEKIVKCLHPTPAICGIPLEAARSFILNNEQYDREFYTGYLGVINLQNNSNLYVNLRCMQLREKEAIIYVGGGITKDSLPEKEWIETVNKSSTIKKVLM